MLKHIVNHCISILCHNLWHLPAHELILVVWYHVWQNHIAQQTIWPSNVAKAYTKHLPFSGRYDFCLLLRVIS